MFLTDKEVAELTGRTRRDAQGRALADMGISARRRPDGSFAVLRAHVEQLMGAGVASGNQRKAAAPRFDMVK